MIARRNTKISIVICVVNQLQFAKQYPLQISRKLFGTRVILEELAQPIVPECCDHLAVSRS